MMRTYEEHEDGVVTVLDTLQENTISRWLDAAKIVSLLQETIQFLLDKTNLEANPTAHRNDRRDGSSGGINYEGQLFTGNAKRVKDGKHGLTNNEAVGIIIEEDETAGEEGGEKASAG